MVKVFFELPEEEFSHGNSNLSKYSFSDCLLIGDGCAIGAYIQNLDNMADARYASPERYCAEFLTFITQNTPAQYTKSKLNECYTKDCCYKGSKCEFFTHMPKNAFLGKKLISKGEGR